MSVTKEIQNKICNYSINRLQEAVCENFEYRGWEMDVALISKSGMLHEYEVKISRSDFLADKKKGKWLQFECKNDYACPNYFYYVCPTGLIKSDEIPVYAGLYYYEDGRLSFIQKAKRFHPVPHNKEWILRKMLRLTNERKYLGASAMTIREREKKLINIQLTP